MVHQFYPYYISPSSIIVYHQPNLKQDETLIRTPLGLQKCGPPADCFTMGHKSPFKIIRSVKRITKFLQRKMPLLTMVVLPSIDIAPAKPKLSICHVQRTIIPSKTYSEFLLHTSSSSTIVPVPVQTEQKSMSLEDFKTLLKNESELRAKQRSNEQQRILKILKECWVYRLRSVGVSPP